MPTRTRIVRGGTWTETPSQAGITLMELLVVCVIGVVVTGGLILMWFNISRSSAMTVSHAEARDFARDGIARLSREIRDVEALAGEQAVQEADGFSIAFTTTFNTEGNESDLTTPRLVRYRYEKPRLYRDVYAKDVTRLSGGVEPERTDVVIPYMLNTDATPLFSYVYVDDNGVRQPEDGDGPVNQVSDEVDRARILLVRIRALVDLDPGKAPNAMDVTTQVQLRNQRLLD